VEQQEAGATALTGPQNTKNDVEVDVAKKIQVEKAAKTTLTTNTEVLEAEPTDLEREEPTVRENPYSIDETHQEEDIADHGQDDGVANKKESRGSP
jgi:hypothetical protein